MRRRPTPTHPNLTINWPRVTLASLLGTALLLAVVL